MNRQTGLVPLLLAVAATAVVAPLVSAGAASPVLYDAKAIEKQIGGLRSLDDARRTVVTKQLALDIRALPASAEKVSLATSLAFVSTEGDFGRDALQEVTTTLDDALHEKPTYPANSNASSFGYGGLARLVHYEGMKSAHKSPELAAAIGRLAAADKRIERAEDADFTLPDLEGKAWRLTSLRGKVVLVNFWATWCPPCRKELPDIQALANQFRDRGLVVLGITDEKPEVVKPWVAEHKLTYPILLDSGRKVNTVFHVEGIPYTAIYGRDGRLKAQAIDMRTRKQFLTLLAKAGIH
jgi:peroxiredoxin